MANSSSVSSGDLATADQYNNLRDDVLSTSSGHLHDGSAGRGDGAFVLQVSGVPLTIENSTDATSNQVLLLRGDNATRADGDEIYMSFNMDDDGGNTHEFARITADAVDVSNGSEDGELRFGVSVAGTMTDVFTINSSTAGATSISYEVDAFTIKGEEGGAGVLYLFADQGDDAGDEWKVNAADGGVLTFGNDIASAGSYVTHMTMTPNSTVACSTVAFAGNVTVASDLTVSGGCITLACSKIFSGGDTTSLNLIDALDATTEATIEGAIDTLSNLGTIGKACATTNIVAGDITMYNAVNNGNPTISLGSASAERLIITANYDSGAQTLCNVEFATAAASGTANKGKFVFDVDGTDIATIDDGGIDIASGKTFSINGSDISTTDTTYTAGDGLTLTGTDFDLDAALTTVTSILATDVKIGEDDQTKIDFEDANTINFYANNAKDLVLSENALTPGTSDGTALGTTSLMWSDAFLASGAVVNFNNGDVTLTHSACTLTVAGGTLAAAAITGTTIDANSDFTIGTTVITDDVVTFTPSCCDTVVMTAATNGAFSLVTTDTAAAAANIQITADGTVDIDSAGNMTLDSGADVEINADGGCVNFKDGSLALAAIVNTSCVGELRIHEAANYVGFKTPALTGNTTYTLPAAYAACTGMALTSTDAGVLSWAAAGGGAVVREGGSLEGEGGGAGSCDAGTEASTTSTSAVDLLGASSLTIAGAQPAKVVVDGRKSSGAAAAAGYGLKLTTTTVQEAVSSVSNGIGGFTSGNEAQEISIVGELRPRVANYTIGKYVGVIGAYVTSSGGALGTGFAPGGSPTAAYPTAEITAVLIRGITANGCQTLFADELNVYSFATS